LSGSIYVTINSENFELKTGSSYAFPKGTEYQLATSGDFDAEVIFCQGSDYEEYVEQLTPPDSVSVVSSIKLPTEPKPTLPMVNTEKAQQYAEKLQAQRKAKETQRKQALQGQVESEDGPVKKTPPPSKGRAPLSGQQVEGVSPRPVGARGFSE